MSHKDPPKPLTNADASQSFGVSRSRLTDEQFDSLRRCAKGLSLRFEAQEIVDALVAGGYVKEGVARVITVTAKGLEYLQKHGS